MILLPTATSRDIQKQQPRVTVLPIGSFEQHGRYLPLITDTAIAWIIGRTPKPYTCSRRSRCRAATSTRGSPAWSASARRPSSL
ncbi:creatininase family protein [Streptomyces goshikiensis]|uniref:creatininase family protein n=1 Tax=Streptomyces goshikiensis TaxID=1942 RepID=UPI0036945BEC